MQFFENCLETAIFLYLISLNCKRMKITIASLLVSLSVIFCICPGVSQVQHNFPMGPSKTSCDSTDISSVHRVDLADTIRKLMFRYVEEFRISRYKTPRHAWFHSCDGATGFLIAKESEDLEVIFDQVKKSDWDEFVKAKDPIASYKQLKVKYATID